MNKLLAGIKSQYNRLMEKEKVKKVVNVIRIPFVGYLLLAFIMNIVVEMLSRHSLFKAIAFIGKSPLVFFYNTFIIFVTLSLVLFAKRKVFATIFVCTAWIISAFANWIVLFFRTTPFSAIDILMLRNVMTMIDKYMTKWQIVLSIIGMILVVALLVYLYIKLPKSKSARRPFRASAYVCMCFILIYTLTKVAVNTKTVSDNFGNLAYAYNDYGFAYCFSNSIIDVGINRPRNYSEDAVKDITGRLSYDKSKVAVDDIENDGDVNKATKQDEAAPPHTNAEEETIQNEAGDVEKSTFVNEPATVQYPNIIVIQLESIFDTKYMKDFYVSESPMPALVSLKSNYSSGLFTVPAVGAGTANTEFEVQTGMSTQFFGAGEYPFKTIMKSATCDSMAYDLKRVGYATAGFHNNDATFYERYIDYSNLGFDVFTGMEHMYNLEYTPRGWAKDNVLDDLMVERMKQTEGRDYITTITVQAHGRYPKKHTDTLNTLTCHFTGQYEGDIEKQAAWEYYINMCRETDDMIADLIEKLEELNEPTVVFMYGDHLPSLSLLETDLDNITLYQTEWVMWDNIGLSVQHKDMTAYQASTYIFDRLKLEGGLMQHFHKAYMDEADQTDYLNKLEMLEYDTLYGEDYAYDKDNPFPQTDMKLGIRDITIERVMTIGDYAYINGMGFNEFSIAAIDGKEVDTEYVSYSTLKISLEDYENGKELTVRQVGDDHIVLSETEPMQLIDDADNQEMNGENEEAEDHSDNQ